MRKKKKTLEDLLEESLIKEEQLYDRPENWVVVKTNAVVDVRDGTHDTPTYQEEGIPLITSKNLKNGKLDFTNVKYISEEAHFEISKRSNVEANDILFAMIGTIGNPVLVEQISQEFSIKNVALFKPDIQRLDCKYLYYYLQSPVYKHYLKSNEKGSTQKFIPLNVLRNAPLYFPPLNEQKRIAEKVERLLNKVEKAKRLIEEAKETFNFRRASVLDKAFRGELTKEWRKNNSLETINDMCDQTFYSLPADWKWIKLSDIMEMQNGMSKRRGTSGKSVPVLRLADVNGTEFVNSNLREIMLSDKELQKYKLEIDDILFIRVNGSFNSVGKAIHFKIPQEIAYCDHLIRGTFNKEQINPIYVKYLFESPLIRNQLKDKIVSSAGQNTVSQGSLGSLMIPLPPKEEMDEIVEVLESVISKEKAALSYLKDNTDIEALKQSILSKAFRGELGTNESDEENAIELLKEVFQERAK
ncbi:restriction endonuclease subunit S [Priestia aryabhattai]|uniref:restriction endonuclease subunit S n=1 Tax=Priestia aryabhattai TaxID=412384 RepID=UPI003983A791